MAEITRRRNGQLTQGVFRILRDVPDGVPAREVLARLEATVPPTPFERTEYEGRPGVRRYEKIVRFATFGPVKAGWMVKSKGRWILTEAGRTALDAFPDPESFHREAGRLYRRWAQSREADAAPPDDDVGSDQLATADLERQVASVFEEAEESAWQEIEAHLSAMDPYDFQQHRMGAGLLPLRGVSGAELEEQRETGSGRQCRG